MKQFRATGDVFIHKRRPFKAKNAFRQTERQSLITQNWVHSYASQYKCQILIWKSKSLNQRPPA